MLPCILLPVVVVLIGGADATVLNLNENGTFNNMRIIMAPYDTIQVGPNTINTCKGSDSNNSTRKKQPPEVYWKDYYGPPIPKDALFAGHQRINYYQNRSMFIGQALFNATGSGLQPVGISNTSHVVNGTYRGFTWTDRNIKVLCTNVEKENITSFLRWVPSYMGISNYKLVVTGFETSIYNWTIDTYSGRTWVQGDVYVGKVLSDNKLHYPYWGMEMATSDYEILAYTKPYD